MNVQPELAHQLRSQAVSRVESLWRVGWRDEC